MATESKKISTLDSLNYVTGEDIVPIVRPVGTTFTNYKIKASSLFGDLRANTNITGTLTVNGNASFSGDSLSIDANTSITNLSVSYISVSSDGITIEQKFTPSNSSIQSTEVGKISFDDNYLYIRTANTEIKRVALTSF